LTHRQDPFRQITGSGTDEGAKAAGASAQM